MDWLRKTEWPTDLMQFIDEFACSPLTTNAGSIDSQRLSLLAKSHAKTPQDTASLTAALYLVANDLDASHELSQGIHSKTGSYLHGIMHRREKDFSNAKYWFHQAGDMNCFEYLSEDLSSNTTAWLENHANRSGWNFDPAQLTDWHRMAIEKTNRDQIDHQFVSAIEDIAWQEWRWLTNSVIKSRQ